jgi:O-antigen/teichoic acid export membrane protein
VLRSAAYAATVLLSLVSAPLLIRHLGIADFGRYTTVLALVTIVAGLTDAGLLNIALREWSTRSGEDRSSVMRSLLGLRIELSAAGLAIGVAFALAAAYSGVLVLGTLIAGIGMVLQTTANLLTVALQGELRFGWASVIDVLRQAISVLLIVVLVVIGAGLLPFLAVSVPAGAVALIATAALVRKQMPLWPRMRGANRWPLLRETLPFAAAVAVNVVYFRVTIVVMSLVASAQQTGYFATSFRITEVLVGVPTLAIGTAFPILSRAARDDSARFASATERILELSLIAGAAVVLVVVLSAPFVIHLLGGAAAAPAVPVLQIQAIALLATFLAVASGFALLSLRRYSALLIGNSVALLANVVLTLVLVPIDQAKGAAIAAVIAEGCLAAGQTFLLLRGGPARIRLAALPPIALAGIAGASLLLVPGLHPLIRTVVGLAIFFAILAAFGQLPPELKHMLRRGRNQ